MNQQENILHQLHDIKNLLTVYQGFLDLLEHPRLSLSDQKAWQKKLRTYNPIIRGQIDLLLSQQTTSHRRRTNLSRLCQESVSLWQRLSLYKSCVWRVSIAAGLFVQADARSLRSLCYNLLGNAVLHGSSRTPIQIDLMQQKGKAVLSIQNKRSGVSSTIRKGFGMHCMLSIVRALGGEMSVRAEKKYHIKITLPILG